LGRLRGKTRPTAKVPVEPRGALNCKQIVERAVAKGSWRSEGMTPAATIYNAILREIQHKGEGARFRRAERSLEKDILAGDQELAK